MSLYLKASMVRRAPRAARGPLASGVLGPVSEPAEPSRLRQAEARLPAGSLVADMISWSCFWSFSLISRVSDRSAGTRRVSGFQSPAPLEPRGTKMAASKCTLGGGTKRRIKKYILFIWNFYTFPLLTTYYYTFNIIY